MHNKFRGIIDDTVMQCRDDLEKIELENVKRTFDILRPPHDADEEEKECYHQMIKLTEEQFIRRFDPISDTAKVFFQQYLEEE